MNNKLLSLILKEKNLIISGILISLVLFICYLSYVYKPMYSTEIQLFVRNIPKNNIVTEYDGGTAIQSESGFSNPLFNLTNIITSRGLGDRIYDIISVKYPQDMARLKVKSKDDWSKVYPKLITAKIVPTTDIIQVSFNWINKKNADAVLSDIVREFKLTNVQIKRYVESSQKNYIDRQVADIGANLDNIRREIKDYKLRNRIVNIDNETSELIRARIDLQKQAELLRGDVSYNNSKLADLVSQLSFPNARIALRATAIGNDPYLIKLHQDLSTAQQNYSKLKAKFKDTYPDVKAAKNEINEIKKNISIRQRESLSGAHIGRGIYDQPSQDIVTDLSRVQAERASAISRLNTIQAGINDLIRKEASLPAKYVGLQELQKQEDALAEAYNNAKQKQMEAAIKENEIVDNIIVLGHPSVPTFLSSIILIRLFAFLAFGLFGSIGIAWIKEDIKDRWSDSKEIEMITGKRILGIIPWLKSKYDISTGFIQEANSVLGVTYRSITANIVSKSYLDEAQVISFVSTIASRNHSSIVSNISATLARLNKSVILVDTDFTEPGRLLENLNISVPQRKGLVEVINNINKYLRLNQTISNELVAEIIKDALIPISVANNDGREIGFYYMCASKKVDNIYDHIATRGFSIIIDFLKKHNEFVLIETPATPFIFPEISAITSISDATVLVSAMETSRGDLIDIIESLDKSNVKVLGIITREQNSELEEHFMAKNSEESIPEELLSGK